MTAKGGTGGAGTAGNSFASNGTTPSGSGGILLPPTYPASNTAAVGAMRGGSPIFGGGGTNAAFFTLDGPAGAGYGAGGSGGYKASGTTARAGGTGAPAMIMVIEFK